MPPEYGWLAGGGGVAVLTWIVLKFQMGDLYSRKMVEDIRAHYVEELTDCRKERDEWKHQAIQSTDALDRLARGAKPASSARATRTGGSQT